ncbi:TetR/AcrR family transcriptional regulator [Sphingomonadales bacterium 56]|uniref:TetR/AcrR family transcriptional regulator n=1 Tax=unclassified Sphingobium TaxID=2611147 RepID=UPI00191A11A0|nr:MULTISPECIES: TetR/AcrR family transcriptional regulator [unclassified Sphingobium]MBY2929827.1 TetR/AcrR family transcriptional regulator [Sphingomonadales bacterium 56]MBY2959990.1 TetR/AcrR family transcriptional regulator [Sphingomonadales bacterium 58]CAD7340172.1 Nucleoid occlusion factor SlmA [Sphingobium sp. S6]CAD7340252.1 Nucleoid occlusion factor SlmA [Sphingobium sp. S8]
MVEITSQPVHAERDNRTQILNAAGQVFLADGFERTSVDRIAAVAHMSKQSIYELYPSKLALFEAAVRSKLNGAWLNLRAIDRGANAEDTLTRYAMRLFEGFAEPVNFGLFRANIAAANHVPELAAELHEKRLASSQPLADHLDQLIADGVIIACDTMAMAIRFGGMAVEGARYFLGTELPGKAAQKRIVDCAVHLFLDGYRSVADVPRDAVPAPAIEPPAREGGPAMRLSADKLLALLDAATSEFLEHGYRRASIDRIAAAVRVSKATIYRQFGNKENLLRYIVQRDIFEASQRPFTQIPVSDKPEAALAALAREALDRHLEPANLRMHRLLVVEADFLPDLAQLFYEGRVRRLGDALETHLHALGLPRPSHMATRIFYTLATFAVRFFTASTPPAEKDREIYARECALLFLEGLRADGRS